MDAKDIFNMIIAAGFIMGAVAIHDHDIMNVIVAAVIIIGCFEIKKAL